MLNLDGSEADVPRLDADLVGAPSDAEESVLAPGAVPGVGPQPVLGAPSVRTVHPSVSDQSDDVAAAELIGQRLKMIAE